MGTLGRLAPGIGDILKFGTLTVMAVVIVHTAASMASSYEGKAISDLGIYSDSASI
ncbi:MAG: hypothetical protein H8E48_06175 [Chloroflexi bacterium]|nr:hypothetical protein [Chloroflexota bacterium]